MDSSEPRSRVDPATRFYYGVGAVAYGIKDNGFGYFLLLYYNQVLGLPSQSTSLAIFIALVLDALSDPVVGALSDRLHSRWGRRHPFMYAAAIPVAISFYLLWNPPELDSFGLFLFLLVNAALVRTFLTFFEVPSTALAPELTDRYDERTTLSSIRHFFGWIGGIMIAVIAYTVLLVPSETQPVGQLNAQGYQAYGLLGSALIFASIMASSLGTHRKIPDLKKPPPRRGLSLSRTLQEIRETLSNRSFLSIFGFGIFSAMGSGFAGAMSIYLNTYFWELEAKEIGLLVFSGLASAAIALFAAPALSQRMGKKTAAIGLALGAGISYPAPILLGMAGLAPAKGSASLLGFLIGFNVLSVAMIIATASLVSAMMADVVDESELATGRRSEGIFFAARSFISKSLSGLGIVLGTLLLSVIDFPQRAQPGTVDPEIISRLGAGYAPIIVFLFVASVASLATYRITRAQHEATLARLVARDLSDQTHS